MNMRREEKQLKRAKLQKSSQTISGIYKKMEKTHGKDTHGRTSIIFSKLNISKFLTVYDRNEIYFFMEDVKDLIQEGMEIVHNARI